MRRFFLLTSITALIILLTLAAAPAQAKVQTFLFAFSGIALGNQAKAVGSARIEDTLLPNGAGSVNYTGPLSGIGIQSLTLTVTGATTGNGTFTETNFDSIVWWTADTTLNLNKELVGQPTAGNGWGTDDGVSGDFNLFGANPAAPSGVFFFTLGTDGGNGDPMRLTSFRVAPEPGSLALLGTALLPFIGLIRRRK